MAQNGYANAVLVTTEWLAEHLGEEGLVVAEVDENPDLYDEGHVPGAVKLHWREDLQDPVERDIVDRETFERVLGERRAEQVPLAGLGLIARRDESRPVGSLSVGQQRRLALALVIARPPHVFLLDEPTNHLSLALATDLEDALGTYPGAVVIASHDRWLRRRWTGELVELAAGRAVGEPALRS